MLCGAATGGLGSPEPPPCSVGFVFPFILCPGGCGGASHGGGSIPKRPARRTRSCFWPLCPFWGCFFPPGAAPKGSPAPRCPQIPLAPFPTPPSLQGLSMGGTRGGPGACPPLFVPYLSTGTAHKSLGYFRVISLRFGVLDGESTSRTCRCN